jgi:hypothetical protein
VDHTFGSIGGLLASAKGFLFGGTYENAEAKKALAESAGMPHLPVVPLTMNGIKPGNRETVEV